MSKLSYACYAVRTVTVVMSQETLRMVYFSCLHSVMKYGIIFWGNSPYSINICRIQKRIIIIITNSIDRDSGKELFKNLKFYLCIHYIYIYSLLFVVKNKNQCK